MPAPRIPPKASSTGFAVSIAALGSKARRFYLARGNEPPIGTVIESVTIWRRRIAMGNPRRKFLPGAAAAATGAATLGFPMIAKAQGPISMRWQSTWPSKDIFHEYANDFAKKVNDMTGGDLKIEVLPAGAVVPAFDLLDAVTKGTLDGGHGVLVDHYGKQNALALWGSGPAFGMDA